MKTRYAFVALAALSVLLAGASMLWDAHQVGVDNAHWHQAIAADDAHWHQALADTQRKFCGVVGGFTAVPVPRPSDPAANPSRVQSYEWYERFVSLGRSLGC